MTATSSRSKLATFITLASLAFTIAAMVWIFRNQFSLGGSDKHLSPAGDINRVEIMWGGHSIELRKVPINQDSTQDKSLHDTGRLVWTVQNIDDAPPSHMRANQKFTAKFVDLLTALAKTETADVQVLDPSQAHSAGIPTPTLAINAGWDKPDEGEESFIFGNPTEGAKPGSRRQHLFLPRGPKLVLVGTALPSLLEGKTVFDFQDRRLTTFETDDVEGVKTQGRCKPLALERDGSTWKVHEGTLSVGAIEEWLDQFTTLVYSEDRTDITPDALRSGGKTLCTVDVYGRLGRKEKLEIYASDSGYSLLNSQLPGVHRIESSALTLLIPASSSR